MDDDNRNNYWSGRHSVQLIFPIKDLRITAIYWQQWGFAPITVRVFTSCCWALDNVYIYIYDSSVVVLVQKELVVSILLADGCSYYRIYLHHTDQADDTALGNTAGKLNSWTLNAEVKASLPSQLFSSRSLSYIGFCVEYLTWTHLVS